MIHYLIIGYLDIGAVNQRRVVAQVPTGGELLTLLESLADPCGHPLQFEGVPVIVTADHIKCPWYVPKRNHQTEGFALAAAREHGCVVADIEHGRVLSMSDLEKFDPLTRRQLTSKGKYPATHQ